MKGDILFASCNRQDKSQDYWKQIGLFHPDIFLWIGDVVYSKKQSLDALKNGLQKMSQNEGYLEFIKKTKVDGVWDDHDYGINDAGKHVIDRLDRQKEYVQFLMKSGSEDLETLLHQDGLYHSRDIMVKGISIKMIFLDTRSFRDSHFIRSIGEFEFPGTAVLAGAIRAGYSLMGYGRNYAGEILGASQWSWLEETLKTSTSDVHIIVSSIQILTTNPVVESWGHFPVEKRKLFNLLSKYDPYNVFFLSGDVHMGEFSNVAINRENGGMEYWLEATSSGLTHTCTSSTFQKALCPVMTTTFSKHRFDNSYTHEKNFGGMTFQHEINRTSVEISIFTLEERLPRPILTYYVPLVSKSLQRSKIKSVEYEDFPVLPQPVRLLIYLLFLAAIYIVYFLLSKILHGRGRLTRKKQK
jgi:alkaline phosphatase D